ncbi:TetR/AcrR family transcriptional regulator [Vibrio sp. MA64]|uniref:TetR/AcrR family transcriptional regulator n=1 Tax=Vibrio sp. MA64 TaxID=2896365 RepID=UPI001E5FF52F|nr:TetR/AcrR family transcriptional regulator [Vibrio sp. MA64]MCC9650184.1 TetR/AcrR family transcriptional regulator [Vibrio sp. MA64]
MIDRVSARPGGRSTRIQQAVHKAVLELQAKKKELTIPNVAEYAGVTPSTIYRRWGTINELVSDVSLSRLHPDTIPSDTGSLTNDLIAFIEHYHEEMISVPGQQMLRDILASNEPAGRESCFQYARQSLTIIINRELERADDATLLQTSEKSLLELFTDRLLAPLFYRSIYAGDSVSNTQLHLWIHSAVQEYNCLKKL